VHIDHRDGGSRLQPGDEVEQKRRGRLAACAEAAVSVDVAGERPVSGDASNVEPAGGIAGSEGGGEWLAEGR
jgi:hypothetical protein